MECIQVGKHCHGFLAVLQGSTAGLGVSAAAVLFGNGIDVVFTGAQFAQHSLFALGEIHPNVHTTDLAHHVDHTAGDGKIVHAVRVGLFSGRINVGNRLVGQLDLEHELRTQLDKGKIIGGILGGTYWGWMYVDILWVHENHRKKGIGSRLLRKAEEEAISGGCHHVHLDTMSWQAPEFYKKHGYEIIGVLPDIPSGNQKYLLMKALRD